MRTLTFKRGVQGLDEVRTNVTGVREQSERWLHEESGIWLIAITVDYADGSSEYLDAIRTTYTLR